jgi:hypothetical protein
VQCWTGDQEEKSIYDLFSQCKSIHVPLLDINIQRRGPMDREMRSDEGNNLS